MWPELRSGVGWEEEGAGRTSGVLFQGSPDLDRERVRFSRESTCITAAGRGAFRSPFAPILVPLQLPLRRVMAYVLLAFTEVFTYFLRFLVAGGPVGWGRSLSFPTSRVVTPRCLMSACPGAAFSLLS